MVKIYIETYGCSHNFADSEHMASLLKDANYDLVNNLESADLTIINTCTVKTPTEHAFFNRLNELKKENKKIVVAGCIPQTDSEKIKDISIIGTYQTDKVVKVVSETLNGNVISLIGRDSKPSLTKSSARINPLIEIIPINLGCLGQCTYCKTKAARGNLNSYTPKEIIIKARQSLNEGVKEIWLTSQDTAVYGFDINTNVAKLLTEICKINKDFKIRLGMGNPDHFVKIKDELVEVMKDKKVYKFLHIPLQSGNNSILKTMKREYTIEQYKEIIEKFKQEIPEMTISTDIICGFPGETKEQFQDSINLVKETKPDIVNVSRYWSRSKTPAALMKNQIPTEEIMQRSEELSKLARKISQENKSKLINWAGEVLINEVGKEENQWKARTPSYNQILINGDFRLGQKTNIKIISATVNDLIAK